MDRLKHKNLNAGRRSHRVRTILGNGARPRLSVNVSHLHVTAQIIDDAQSKTLAYSTTVGQKIEGNMTAKAAWVGTDIAKKAQKASVKKVAFDRGARKYHGRIKALADAAREGGLEF